MGTRIHPMPGEPFCPSCHAGDPDTECSEEHMEHCLGDDRALLELRDDLDAARRDARLWRAAAQKADKALMVAAAEMEMFSVFVEAPGEPHESAWAAFDRKFKGAIRAIRRARKAIRAAREATNGQAD